MLGNVNIELLHRKTDRFNRRVVISNVHYLLKLFILYMRPICQHFERFSVITMSLLTAMKYLCHK
jgi:hypothetical protein